MRSPSLANSRLIVLLATKRWSGPDMNSRGRCPHLPFNPEHPSRAGEGACPYMFGADSELYLFLPGPALIVWCALVLCPFPGVLCLAPGVSGGSG